MLLCFLTIGVNLLLCVLLVALGSFLVGCLLICFDVLRVGCWYCLFADCLVYFEVLVLFTLIGCSCSGFV